ncbi:DUF3597 domain-containing protein [Xylophilus sp. GOD-11R]|uniref:DUF3597 domain-containing protein n=1 Tax=Xylophilus sp. GOD-11R TaxID=3089814 RepID=UPI00298CA901|nr:DUF3597 domain-containing protein [Xylophilus sp. GOD-11R]WPB58791.1 DUF3597 domain-containing protein [Xylophilus sp. GOD-11R]
MSIFGNILGKFFPSANAATPAATATPQGLTSAIAGAPAAGSVDIAQVIEGLIQKAGGGTFNWKSSIVDLMKLLGLDSSLPARQALAKELGFSGDSNDSAAMNVWLHKTVMAKLAANGGKLPADLKA